MLVFEFMSYFEELRSYGVEELSQMLSGE